MKEAIDSAALAQLFTEARTANGWLDKPVAPSLLRELYDLAKMGPTAQNTQPMRLVFLTTPQAKERLVPALSPGNVDKTRQAPLSIIVATDRRFYDLMPKIWHNPAARETFVQKPELAQATAARNATLQGGYLILAARALGLDCGPMSGFDIAKVDAEFFPDGRWTANFLCNLGYGDDSKLLGRQPRLGFEEACVVL